MRTTIFSLLLLAASQAAYAQALSPTAKEAQARKRAAYARTNERHQAEIRHQQMVAEFQAMQRLEALREARTASPARSRPKSLAEEKPWLGKSNYPSVSDVRNRKRPDESGISGRGLPPGGPGPLPHSKNIRTGEVIPSFMIPKGYGRYYTPVDSR